MLQFMSVKLYKNYRHIWNSVCFFKNATFICKILDKISGLVYNKTYASQNE